MVLEHKTEWIDLVFDQMGMLVVQMSPHGEVLYVSHSAGAVLGFDPELFDGFYWWEESLENQDKATELKALLAQASQSKRFVKFEFEREWIDSSKRKRWFNWVCCSDSSGNILCIGHDVTVQKNTTDRLNAMIKDISSRNVEFIESLRYARSVQQAFLPVKLTHSDFFVDSFVLYRPKDHVSGDFYWCYQSGSLFFVAAIDCTGHGVPGALMTILSRSLLKHVVKTLGLHDPAEILYAVDQLLLEDYSRNSGVERNEGLDITLCVLNQEGQSLKFAAANQQVFRVRKHELSEFKGDRFPLGLYHDVEKTFTTQEINLESGDRIFLFSDGFMDQFGGNQFKKMNRSRFRKIILDSSFHSISDQSQILELFFDSWRGQNEQTDDMMVIGLQF